MSKWTLEKILACEEIQEGSWFSRKASDPYLILSKRDDGFWFWDKAHSQENGFHGTQDWCEFKFYSGCGTEILPPKDKKKIKISGWLYMYSDGDVLFYENKLPQDNFVLGGVNRIACEYFEREIEIEE